MMLHSLKFSSIKLVSQASQSLIRRRYHGIEKFSHLIVSSSTSFKVKPNFGTLQLSASCNCVIRSASPEKYPDGDYANVTIWSNEKLENIAESSYQEQSDNLLKVHIPNLENVLCDIQLPMKYDLQVDLADGCDFWVNQIEPEVAEIKIKSGNISTKNFKCGNINISMENGSVSFNKMLQGNVFIIGKSVNLKTGRLQGNEMSIQSDELSAEIESSYIKSSSIITNKGQMKLKNLHGSTDIKCLSGNITIQNLHGAVDLAMEKGDAQVHMSQLNADSGIHIKEGRVDLSLIDTTRQNIQVSAPSVTCSEDLKSRVENSNDGSSLKIDNGDMSVMKVFVAKGHANMKLKDWFSTLGLLSRSKN